MQHADEGRCYATCRDVTYPEFNCGKIERIIFVFVFVILQLLQVPSSNQIQYKQDLIMALCRSVPCARTAQPRSVPLW